MKHAIRGCLGVLLALVLAVPAVARADGQGVQDGLVALIADQVRHTNSSVSNEALAALRRLRDPRLRPVFVRMSSDSNPERVIGALLGMADLEDPPRVDVVRMAELSNENARAGAVGLTLRLGYLDPDGLDRVASWPKLGDTLETLLMAELLGVDRTPSPARLAELSRSDEPLARTLAILLEGSMGEEAQRELADKLLDELRGRERVMERVLEPVLLALRRAKSVNSAAFVKRLGDRVGGDMGLEREILRTLAVIEPEAARQRWMSAYRGTDSLARRFSLGLAALHTDGGMGEAAYAALVESDNATLRAMGRAALALASPSVGEAGGQEAVDALIALLDTKYDPATGWTIDQGRKLEVPWRIRFAQELIRWPGRTGERSMRAALVAYEGSRLLAGDDPAALRRELDRMVGSADEAVLRSALRGIIESPDRGRVWSAGDEPRWPSRATEATAAICAGLFDLSDELADTRGLGEREVWEGDDKQADALTERLVSAATTGALLPEPARVQAAWLALVRLEPGSEAATRLLHRLSR